MNFAYVGSEDRGWSGRREERSTTISRNAASTRTSTGSLSGFRTAFGNASNRISPNGSAELPTPIGLFACDDDRGREVLEACTIAGLQVPEDVAVVGVDNDEVFCDLSDPPLSSVALNVEAAGYRAAQLLDGMMRGRIRKPRRIVVEAVAVVHRRSTDMVAH